MSAQAMAMSARAASACERLSALAQSGERLDSSTLAKLERDLLDAKRQLLRSRGGEESLGEIDRALALPALSARARQGAFPAPLAALLPPQALRPLLLSAIPILPDEDGCGLAHCLVDLMSSYALLPETPAQLSFWPNDPLEQLTEALNCALQIHPQFCQELDDEGQSPLHLAVYLLSLEALPLLLSAGANPSQARADGLEAMNPDAFRCFIQQAPNLPHSARRALRMLTQLERLSLEASCQPQQPSEEGASDKGRL